MIHLLPQWASRSHLKGWIQWHKDKTKENDASMTDCLQQTAARQGQKKKKGEKKRRNTTV